MDSSWDVVVVGAGPAGLFAATHAAERGSRVLLLEKNHKPGVKILMSGGTRCNLTHATDRKGIVEAFGKQGPFLHSALAELGPNELIQYVEAEGVATKVEATGKVFPCSNKSNDILQAILKRLRRSQAQLILGEHLVDWNPMPEGMHLVTSQRALLTRNVILTTGGQSYPGCGTTGDGYPLASKLGHSIIAPRPALVPLLIREKWSRELSGMTLPDVQVKVIARDLQPNTLITKRGSFLFTHFGCSGPVVLNVSGTVTLLNTKAQLELECDWLPERPEHRLHEWLKDCSQTQGGASIASTLAEILPRRLVEMLCWQANLASDRRWAGLNRMQREQLVRTLKKTRLTICGTLGFNKAEVTAGGIALPEIDARTMRSKRFPPALFAGELLDLDGPIGGYNFQAAFSTGWLAGMLKT